WWRRAAPPDASQFARYALADVWAGGHKDDPDPTMRAWMATERAPLDKTAPPVNIARMRASGCRALRFRGREVLELCFERNGTWFHLYVLPGRRGARFAPFRMGASDGSAAVWSDGRFTYAVATKAALGVLEKLL
ncbi:MAG: hypothetical protein ACREFX_09140, partial [Opitutaceae bacterium]